jgi:hypothetical protein
MKLLGESLYMGMNSLMLLLHLKKELPLTLALLYVLLSGLEH